MLSASCQVSGDSAATGTPVRTEIKTRKIYSAPRKASILSAIIPGAGQVMNRKYWKLPVLYAGFAGFGYMFYVNNSDYHNYRNNLIGENTSGYSPEQLKELKDEHKKSRDFAAIGIGALYILNIIDANVDAHLRTFDVSDDLGIRIAPVFIKGYATGISLKFIL